MKLKILGEKGFLRQISLQELTTAEVLRRDLKPSGKPKIVSINLLVDKDYVIQKKLIPRKAVAYVFGDTYRNYGMESIAIQFYKQ